MARVYVGQKSVPFPYRVFVVVIFFGSNRENTKEAVNDLHNNFTGGYLRMILVHHVDVAK